MPDNLRVIEVIIVIIIATSISPVLRTGYCREGLFLSGCVFDSFYLARVNGTYLRHVKFCIVRGPPLFIVSPVSQHGPLPTLTVPGWAKVHDGEHLRPLF